MHRLSHASLRVRLLLGLLALAAVGLFVANLVTYSLLRSALIERLDGQLSDAATAALPVLQMTAEESLRGPPQGGRPNQGPNGFPGRRPALQPLGVVGLYAELRDPSGVLLASTTFPAGDESLRPDLPTDLDPPEAGVTTLQTVTAEDGTEYRVVQEQTPVGGTLLVALPLSEVEGTLDRLVRIEVVVTLVVLAGLGVSAWVVVRAGLAPLRRMEVTAEAIAAGDLSQRVPDADPRTEVGRLAGTFNVMVDRIEGAFATQQASEQRLRQFLSDASHELRTPLTSIRGYAELFRRGAADRPEDLAVSLRRIEEEATRMGVLVDELLLLARLDQGRPPTVAPTDLSVLATDAVRDAGVVTDGHTIELSAPDPVVVSGDDAQLRQVLANLVMNAITHTPAGTTVRVKTVVAGDRGIVEVSDDGPGMAPADAARVFDRFARVDDGRTRDRGGAGLGLAIAKSIVEAHGGTVHLRTAPGIGSTFTVDLPRSS